MSESCIPSLTTESLVRVEPDIARLNYFSQERKLDPSRAKKVRKKATVRSSRFLVSFVLKKVEEVSKGRENFSFF